jgi:predicted MPP superfamily phosphohydrolase
MSPITRRRLLGTAAGVLSAAVFGESMIREPTAIEVSRHDVPVPGLSAELDGLRIALLTDVHLHHGIGSAAREALERLAIERPDVVALIGDICNARGDLDDLAAWSRQARGTTATFATLGNWEHDAGIDRATADRAYSRAGVELLCNSSARVTRGGAAVSFVGIDDPVAGRPDLPAAIASYDADTLAVWLVHAPGWVDSIPRAVTPPPAAILSGHTHGGQIRLPLWTPYLPYGSGRFLAGWYRDTVAPLYVSRGIGTVAIPVRFCAPPELPVFTLRRS